MTIESFALELNALKKTASQALAEGNIETFLDTMGKETELRRKLRVELTAGSLIEVESKSAKDLLRKIRSELAEEQQAMDEVLSKVEDQGTCGLLIENPKDVDDLVGTLLYSWFTPRDYVWGLFRTGAVVIRCSVPVELKNLVEEVRQCFAFQQYNAVVSLCRTIVERAVTDIGLRIGAIPPSAITHKDFYKQYPPWQRIDSVTQGTLRKRLREFYHSASELIHGRKTANMGSALEALKCTLKMIEELYSVHREALSTKEK